MSFQKIRAFQTVGGLFILIGVSMLFYAMRKVNFTFLFLSILLTVSLGAMMIIWYRKLQNRTYSHMKKYISSLKPSAADFNSTVVFIPDSMTVKLAIDQPAQRLYIWQAAQAELQMNMPFHLFDYAFDDVTAVNVIINKQQIASMSNNDLFEEETVSIMENMNVMELRSAVLEIHLKKFFHILPFYQLQPGNGNKPVFQTLPAYKNTLKLVEQCYAQLYHIMQENSMEIQTAGKSKVAKPAMPPKEIHTTADSSYDILKEKETPPVPAPSETKKESAFADFERFLESNKQKQYESKKQSDQHE